MVPVTKIVAWVEEEIQRLKEQYDDEKQFEINIERKFRAGEIDEKTYLDAVESGSAAPLHQQDINVLQSILSLIPNGGEQGVTL